MLKLRDGIIELYKKVATSIPPDIEEALVTAFNSENKNLQSKESLRIILENINLARSTKRPVCQDTGIPVFQIRIPRGLSTLEVYDIVIEATRKATEKVPLRANAVDIISELNSNNNTGVGFPVIYFEESNKSSLVIDLMLKGAGCENAGQFYKLPDLELGAERDLEGLRKCVIDTVLKAQGNACPPYTLGVGIGGAMDQVAVLAKKQLFRRLNDKNQNPQIASLEERLAVDINKLGIGPLGLEGKTTVLGVKVSTNHRHPASFFVDVSVSCWANRRGRLIWS